MRPHIVGQIRVCARYSDHHRAQRAVDALARVDPLPPLVQMNSHSVRQIGQDSTNSAGDPSPPSGKACSKLPRAAVASAMKRGPADLLVECQLGRDQQYRKEQRAGLEIV